MSLPEVATPRRHYTEDEKRRIVDISFQAGARLQELAKKHGICPTTLSNWRRTYRAETLTSPDLLPVNVISQQPLQSTRTHIAIDFPSGTSIRIHSDALDYRDLATFLSAVER